VVVTAELELVVVADDGTNILGVGSVELDGEAWLPDSAPLTWWLHYVNSDGFYKVNTTRPT